MKILIYAFFIMLLNFSNIYPAWEKCNSFGKITFFYNLGDTLIGGTNSGLIYSIDDGTTWKLIENNIASLQVNSLIKVKENYFALTPNKGMFISKNIFSNWDTLDFPSKDANNLCYSRGRIYASTYDKGCITCDEYGKNWKEVNNGLIYKNAYYIFSYKDEIYLSADQNFYVSKDEGNTWQSSNINSVVRCSYKKNDTVYCGADAGMYIKTPTDTNWRFALLNSVDYSITSIYVNDNEIYAYVNGLGLHISYDRGTVWESVQNGISGWVNTYVNVKNKIIIGTDAGLYFSGKDFKWKTIGFPNFYIYDVAKNENIIYITIGDQIYISEDKGLTWRLFSNDIVRPSYSLYCHDNRLFRGDRGGLTIFSSTGTLINSFCDNLCYAVIAKNDTIIFTTLPMDRHRQFGTYISFNNGKSFIKSNSPPSEYIYSYSIKNDDLYAATYDGMFKSSNMGLQWSPILKQRTRIDEVYTSKDVVFGLTNTSLLRSFDDGKNFDSIQYNKYNFTINCLNEYKDIILVGSNSQGVMISYDKCSSFSSFNLGIPKCGIADLKSDNEFLYAFTHENGIYRFKIPQKINPTNIIYPLDGSTDITRNTYVNWNKVPEAGNFHLQISENKYFDNFVIDTIVADTCLYIKNLKSNAVYYARVKGKFIDLESEMSPTISFKTGEILKINTFSSVTTFYPNPVTEEINIKNPLFLNFNCKWQIINLIGENILGGVFNENQDTYKINIQNLNNGIYFLKLNYQYNSEIFKFEKIK